MRAENDSALSSAAQHAAAQLNALTVPDSLVYTTDAEPGILRLRKGKGFSYRRHDGTLVRDGQELRRIRQLAIPPAYCEVWICASANGHLQATGRDARGRKQYRYHEDWRRERDAEKFGRFEAMARLLPRIRRIVARDLREPEHGRTPVLAALVRLLDTTLGRIGNEEYARENGSYGLTTLCNRHVSLDGSRVQFAFRGKSGVAQVLSVRDAAVAHVVRSCLQVKGKALFRYADSAGAVHSIGSDDVNEYLRDMARERLSAKDFRTWHASVMALEWTWKALERGPDGATGRFTLHKMLGHVSDALGNTPAVCRKSYVHPQVLALATAATRDPAGALQKLRSAFKGDVPLEARSLRLAEQRLVKFVRAQRKGAGAAAKQPSAARRSQRRPASRR